MKRKLLDNALVSVLTMLIVGVFVLLPLSFSVFNTSQNLKEQYSLLDAFYSMRNQLPGGSPYLKVNSDITIVDLSEVKPRQDVYRTIVKIVEAGPRMIGFDVWMEGRDSIPVEDSLEALLRGNPSIVSPCLLVNETAPGSTSFQNAYFPFYADTDTPNLGAANIDLQGASWNCRTFTPRLWYGERSYPLLTIAMASLLDTSAYEAVMKQADSPHYIQFSKSGYQNLSALFILSDTTGIASSMLKDKIVLVGDTNDQSDLYPTPIKIRMSGVEIHANILSSILTRSWPRTMGTVAGWLLALLGVFCLLPLMHLVKKNEWLSIFSGAIQALLIILFVFVSYWIFVRFNYYVNSIYFLLGIGFMGMADSLYRKITKK